MSFTITPKNFIIKFINKCPIVKSSRLDITIKGLINTFNKDKNTKLINYLNKLRIIYYLNRLEYKDSTKARSYKSKFYYLFLE